jgi:hypothetical protein
VRLLRRALEVSPGFAEAAQALAEHTGPHVDTVHR